MNYQVKRTVAALTGLGILHGSATAWGAEAEMVFRNPFWAGLIPLAISALFVGAGYLGARMGIPNALKWILIMIGVVAGVVVLPMVVLENVTVTKTEITQKTGAAWSPLIKGFSYDEVDGIRLTTKLIGPKERETGIWEITYKDGQVEDLNPSDLWERNTDKIVPWLEKMGVQVVR